MGLVRYDVNGKPVITGGLQFSAWRPPNDNDYGASLQQKLVVWKDLVPGGTLQRMEAAPATGGNAVQVTLQYSLLKGDAQLVQTFTIDGNGALLVDNDFKALKGKHPMMFKIGNHLQLDKAFTGISWYGRGPVENYWDRKAGYFVGQYEGAIANQYYPYVRPQESGNKTDVRWAMITRPDGSGIRIQYDQILLNVSALPYSPEQLFSGPRKQQAHSGELEPDGKVHLHIDMQQMGLGSINSWGALPMEQYRLPYKNYRYSYQIIPVTPGK
jgi:beta-galactosidase